MTFHCGCTIVCFCFGKTSNAYNAYTYLIEGTLIMACLDFGKQDPRGTALALLLGDGQEES
jgi:hypothetical protein